MSLGWYRRAVANLGLVPLIGLQLGRRIGRDRPLGRARSRHLAHPVWYRRTGSDLMVFDQIFIEREYACIDRLTGIDFIVDCGANVGYSSAYFLSRYPGASLVAIEPDPANYDMLCRNLRPDGERARTINAAIWSEPTTLRFDEDTTGEGQEWGRTVSAGGAGGREVPAIDLATVLKQSGRTSIGLLKVDIEGAEEELFARNTEGWLPAVRNFMMEVHGPAWQAAVDRAIAGRGFALSTSGELTVGIGRA